MGKAILNKYFSFALIWLVIALAVSCNGYIWFPAWPVLKVQLTVLGLLIISFAGVAMSSDNGVGVEDES